MPCKLQNSQVLSFIENKGLHEAISCAIFLRSTLGEKVLPSLATLHNATRDYIIITCCCHDVLDGDKRRAGYYLLECSGSTATADTTNCNNAAAHSLRSHV